jgi:hypothetical protein
MSEQGTILRLTQHIDMKKRRIARLQKQQNEGKYEADKKSSGEEMNPLRKQNSKSV